MRTFQRTTADGGHPGWRARLQPYVTEQPSHPSALKTSVHRTPIFLSSGAHLSRSSPDEFLHRAPGGAPPPPCQSRTFPRWLQQATLEKFRTPADVIMTCSMRSVAAPRLIMPSFVIPVEYEDPAGCRAENPQARRRRRAARQAQVSAPVAR